ncbi:glycosyltransferase family 2 protein [Chloroflexota bacterium]
MNGSKVLVYIPVNNEEQTIAQVVDGVKQSCDFDILVVDDGSTDSTRDILRELDVGILTHPVPIPSRIMSGLEVGHALDYEYVVKIDGDGQHNPQDIIRLYKYAVETGADIVIGSRHLNGFKANKFSIKGSGMWFCSKVVSFLCRKRITDTTSGFKIWNRSSCQLAVRKFRKGKLREGSTHHIEELIIAARNKLSVEEIEVIIYPRKNGESRSFSRVGLIGFPLNLIRSTIRALL